MAPALVNVSTMASPIPRELPVTNATFTFLTYFIFNQNLIAKIQENKDFGLYDKKSICFDFIIKILGLYQFSLLDLFQQANPISMK